MASAIDATKPVAGSPTTQSVRDNFATAAAEITALQTAGTTHVAKAGDTMTGSLSVIYANTGGLIQTYTTNTGTGSTAGTMAGFVASLSSITNGYVALNAVGGAAPQGQIGTGGGLTGGLALVSGAGNIALSPGTGTVTATGSLSASSSLYASSASDPGQSTTASGFSGKQWRFAVTAGDDANAGTINYRLFDAAALNISGAGLAGSRSVHIYDNLTVDAAAYKPGGGSWTATSDIRTKEDVADYTAGLDAVLGLRPVTYKHNGRGGIARSERSYVGLVADEVQPVMPEMVGAMRARLDPGDAEDSDILTLDATPLVYALINAIKELRGEIDALKAAGARQR